MRGDGSAQQRAQVRLCRRALLAGASGALAAKPALAHDPGGGGGGDGGGGSDAGIGSEIYGRPLQASAPGFFTPAATPLPEPPAAVAATTRDILATLTPQQRAEWEAASATLEATLWEAAEIVASGLSWLGDWSQNMGSTSFLVCH